MPITTGVNHVATLTSDMDRTVDFYRHAFDATVVFEMPAAGDHPLMKVLDVGAGVSLNVFEVSAADIIGDRRRQGARGAIDHFALAVESLDRLEELRRRLIDAGADDVGEIHRLGPDWSLYFCDPDGMELEVCCSA